MHFIQRFMAFVCVVCLMYAMPLSAQQAHAPENADDTDAGQDSNPFLITTLENLYWISQHPSVWNSNFLQTNNIDASPTQSWFNGAGWMPIGNSSLSSNPFTGSYDGNGYVISGLYINRSNEDNTGLFGRIDDGEIVNLGVTDTQVTGGNNTGIITGYLEGGGIIHRCYSKGEVSGNNNTGGIAGYNRGQWNKASIISETFSISTISGNNAVGGITGYLAYQGRIENAYTRGTLNITDWRQGGGISGAEYSSGGEHGIFNVYSTVGISALGGQVGGIVGAGNSNVHNSFWDTYATGMSNSAGGTGKTTAEMKNVATFTDLATSGLQTPWDFVGNPNDDNGTEEIWEINEDINDGYPFFRWELSNGNVPVWHTRNGGGEWGTAGVWSVEDCDGTPSVNGPHPAAVVQICEDDTMDVEEVDWLIEGRLELRSGATLNLRNNSRLTVTGDIISEGTIRVYSGSQFRNLSEDNPGLLLERKLHGFEDLSGNPVPQGEGWRYITVPTEMTLSDFLEPIWTQGATGSDHPESSFPNVYRWPQNQPGNDNSDWEAVTDLNITTQPGDAFLIYVFADDTYSGSPDGDKLLTAAGFEYGDPAQNRSMSMLTNSTPGTLFDGWTFIGNPFASGIDFETLFNSAPAGSLMDAVYVWTPMDSGDFSDMVYNSGSWASYSLGSPGAGALTGGQIAPFQAFMIQNAPGQHSAALEFSNDTKSSSAETEFLFGGQSALVRLELNGQNLRNTAWLHFSPGGNAESRISGDALQLQPMSQDFAVLSVEKEIGYLYDIAHLPYELPESGVYLNPAVSRSGSFTLSASVEKEVPGLQLYITDTHTGSVYELDDSFSTEIHLNTAARGVLLHEIDAVSSPSGLLMQPQSQQSRFRITSSLTVSSDEQIEAPKTITLKQNYPNPFNPETRISYRLPEPAEVVLEVFNLQGRRVAVVDTGYRNTGLHHAVFDGSRLSSGVYFYRLRAGNFSETKKMMLIK